MNSKLDTYLEQLYSILVLRLPGNLFRINTNLQPKLKLENSEYSKSSGQILPSSFASQSNYSIIQHTSV